jgi:hypothetical protein
MGPSQYSSHLADLRRQGIPQRKLFRARGANYQSLEAGNGLEPLVVAGVEKCCGGANVTMSDLENMSDVPVERPDFGYRTDFVL